MTSCLLALIGSVTMVAIASVMQWVHYPAFRLVAADQFATFHRLHVRGIGPLVMFGMGLEGLGAAWRLASMPGAPSSLGLLLFGFTMLWTGLVSGPIHNRLVTAFSEKLLDRLIWSNGVRLVGWVAHAGLSLAMLLEIRG